MTQQHPDLAEEQAYIDHAYDCLEQSRTDAWKLRDLSEATLGGTFQARYERDVFDEALVNRLTKLDLGDAALVFGRIDRLAESPDEIESFHIGRLAVADDDSEPIVVDWRAPVAEPFYRATGREPMGLRRRRHFAVQGRTLLGLEDELFGDGHLGVGDDAGIDGISSIIGAQESARDAALEMADDGSQEFAPDRVGPGSLRGYSTLLAALERGRTGQLGDIVATIQSEQDEIIRSPQAGVLVVQGGPGTGKTVVALHRAAYLLYTYRFPLEDQGVLVIGPNRVFLRYIERVLPSLGEAGVEQVVLNDLVQDVEWARYGVDPADGPLTATVKGDLRMADVIDQAVTDRERGLRDDLVVPFRTGFLRLRAEESGRIVRNAQRRFRRHNAARKWVEGEVWSAMAATWREGDLHSSEVKDVVRSYPEVRIALERMWPILSPAELLHDLFGSKALLKLAAAKFLSEAEYLSLHRPRAAEVGQVRWTDNDVALLDEARNFLGPRPPRKGQPAEDEEIRTYGHIVIDEVQDLTPMQLRMASRRSLNGSMTVVGDIAQATGALAPDDWDDILAHLPDSKPSRVIGLSVGYRIPERIMELANRVMMAATPTLRAPISVRAGDERPEFIRSTSPHGLFADVASATASLAVAMPGGSIAVVAADAMVDEVSHALTEAGIEHGRATRSGLSAAITVVPVSVVKGLELDGVVVVEPAAIVAAEQQGLRALYVALTRSTRRLSIVHALALPDAMR
jgi:DNA helicase IV